jgi:hypothetical protein
MGWLSRWSKGRSIVDSFLLFSLDQNPPLVRLGRFLQVAAVKPG